MNNYHGSKRKRQAWLFFTYGAMTLATLVISAVCLLLVLGYRFDIKDGRLEQGGLLQFRSVPTDATVSVDGVRQSAHTPSKLEVAAGTHQVEFAKAKYHPWRKTTSVVAGELRWLSYARLVPETIETTARLSAEGATAGLQTPDRKYIATLAAARPLTVTIVDVRDIAKAKQQVWELPAELLGLASGQTASAEIVEWDFGSRFLLVKYTVGTVTQYVRFDRTAEGGAPLDITKTFNLPFEQMHFSGTSGSVLYALTDHDLRKVDIGAKSVSQPLVSGTESYRLYRENDIAFVAVRGDKKLAGVYLDGKETVLRSFEPTEPVAVDLSEYFSHKYAAIVAGARLEIIKDPVTNFGNAGRVFASVALPYPAGWVDFASSGRFVIVGNGIRFVQYDLETDEHTAVNADQTATTQPVWLDDFYLVDNPASTVRIYEFDGNNRYDITAADAALPAFLSEDGKYLLSFGKPADKLMLQSSRLVLE